MEPSTVDVLVEELGVITADVHVVESQPGGPEALETHLARLALKSATAAVLEAIYAAPNLITPAIDRAHAQLARARTMAVAARKMAEQARQMRERLRRRRGSLDTYD